MELTHPLNGREMERWEGERRGCIHHRLCHQQVVMWEDDEEEEGGMHCLGT